MTKDWYIAAGSRIRSTTTGTRARNQKAADQLWWVAFAAGLAAVAFGALGIRRSRISRRDRRGDDVAASIAAYGLIDRRKYLIASFAAMQSRLEEILGLDKDAPMSLADFVTTTEDLLESEHKAWLPQMLGMQHQPPAQPPQQAQPKGEREGGGGGFRGQARKGEDGG